MPSAADDGRHAEDADAVHYFLAYTPQFLAINTASFSAMA